jgi:hypothetical protein
VGIGEKPLQVSNPAGCPASWKWLRGGVFPYLVIGLLGLPAFAQDTELHSCLPDSNACSETEAIPIPDLCGNTFYLYHGRLSWPALRAVGPITVSVQTFRHPDTYFPLYVELLQDETSPDCSTTNNAHFLLDTRGRALCGGLWESVGPIDIIRQFGIARGSLYRIRVAFLQALPHWMSTSPALR